MTTGGTELLVVLAIAVMLFGPKKLPELARTIGEAMGEYHKATREFESEVRKASTSVDKEITTATSLESKTSPAKTTSQKPSGTSPASPAPGRARSPAASAKPQAPPQSFRVKEIAKNLGIDTADKTDAQLLREINIKTKKTEKVKG
jgi:TatA/E family protein of Tat protein translocase